MNPSFNRPTQAVILAGGRGARLAPITDFAPKPMVQFHGRPFLEYLIDLLREQGFKRVLLLLGYRAEAIVDHFGDGSRFDIEITYSVSPPETETGKRVKLALAHLEPLFLLLYCDNYWPMPFADMWRRYQSHEASTMVTVFSNEDASTRDNLRIGKDGLVEIYDKSRLTPDLKGVDIGFMILRRDVMENFPEGNISFRGNPVSRTGRTPPVAGLLDPTQILQRRRSGQAADDGKISRPPPRRHS